LIVAHRVDVAVLVAHHEVGIHSGYVLSDQAELRRVLGVALVMEGHRLERQNRFAGFVHRFNVVLEAARRETSAQFSIGIDKDWNSGGGINRLAEDLADIATVAQVRTGGADSNNVRGRADATAGSISQ